MISLSESQNCKGNCSSGDLLVDFILNWNVESSGFSQDNKVRLILAWKCWNMLFSHSLNETECFDLLLRKHCVLVGPKSKHFIWGMIIASPCGLCNFSDLDCGLCLLGFPKSFSFTVRLSVLWNWTSWKCPWVTWSNKILQHSRNRRSPKPHRYHKCDWKPGSPVQFGLGTTQCNFSFHQKHATKTSAKPFCKEKFSSEKSLTENLEPALILVLSLHQHVLKNF